MITPEEARSIAKEMVNLMSVKATETDKMSILYILVTVLGIALNNIMDNLGEEDCFVALDQIHSTVDLMYTLYAERAKLPKKDRPNI